MVQCGVMRGGGYGGTCVEAVDMVALVEAVDMVALMVEASVQLWVGKVLVEMSQKNGHEKKNVSMVVTFT